MGILLTRINFPRFNLTQFHTEFNKNVCLLCTEQVSDGVYECRYVPRKTKKQVVNVNFGGVAVPGSPFR